MGSSPTTSSSAEQASHATISFSATSVGRFSGASHSEQVAMVKEGSGFGSRRRGAGAARGAVRPALACCDLENGVNEVVGRGVTAKVRCIGSVPQNVFDAGGQASSAVLATHKFERAACRAQARERVGAS